MLTFCSYVSDPTQHAKISVAVRLWAVPETSACSHSPVIWVGSTVESRLYESHGVMENNVLAEIRIIETIKTG